MSHIHVFNLNFRLDVQKTWGLWHFGNKDTHIGPLKNVRPADLEVQKCKVQLSKARKIMEHLPKPPRGAVVVDWQTPFDHDFELLIKKCYDDVGTDRPARVFETAVGTIHNLLLVWQKQIGNVPAGPVAAGAVVAAVPRVAGPAVPAPAPTAVQVPAPRIAGSAALPSARPAPSRFAASGSLLPVMSAVASAASSSSAVPSGPTSSASFLSSSSFSQPSSLLTTSSVPPSNSGLIDKRGSSLISISSEPSTLSRPRSKRVRTKSSSAVHQSAAVLSSSLAVRMLPAPALNSGSVQSGRLSFLVPPLHRIVQSPPDIPLPDCRPGLQHRFVYDRTDDDHPRMVLQCYHCFAEGDAPHEHMFEMSVDRFNMAQSPSSSSPLHNQCSICGIVKQ